MQRIHGLAIQAGVPLPGLAAAHTPCADVELELVERLGAPLPARIRYRAGAADDATARVEIVDDVHGHVAFRYGDGSAFDVDHRTRPARIRAAIAPGQTLEDLTAYLYGPVLGFVLRAWGRLALHASCVRIGDGAVLLAGPPGAGKSTTAAALAMRGLAVVSDDLTALDLDARGGSPRAWPSFDHLRLWPEGERVVLGTDGRLDRITPSWEKRRFPLEGNAFADEPLPVRAILALRPRRGGRAVVRTLGSSRAVGGRRLRLSPSRCPSRDVQRARALTPGGALHRSGRPRQPCADGRCSGREARPGCRRRSPPDVAERD